MAQVTLSRKNFSQPTPPAIKRWLDALEYTLLSLATVSGFSEMLPPMATGIMGVGVIVCKGLKKGLGYAENNEDANVQDSEV